MERETVGDEDAWHLTVPLHSAILGPEAQHAFVLNFYTFPMDQDTFEALVVEAIESLPEPFLEMLDNVAIVVEDWPDRETMRMAGVRSRFGLLGFYHGVPQSGRTSYYGLVPPDKITIYRRPIERQCRTADQVRDLVARVVRHEIAHHFGIDDARLREIGAY
jgi:predicted Zn-dependent protease with MMP-like domain